MATDATNQGGTNNEAQNQNNQNNENKKVTFTDEQQAALNDIIEKRLARERSKAQQELEAERTAKADLEKQLEAERNKATNKGNNGAGNGEETPEQKQFRELLEGEKAKATKFEQAAAKAREEAANARASEMKTRKEVAISRASSGCNFHSLDAVLKLTTDMIEWSDEEKTFVVRENGIIKQNNELKPMSLDEFYKDYAAKNAFLVNGDVIGGAGSSENRGGNNGGSLGVVNTKADLKTVKDKMEYIKRNGLDKYEALPLK